MNIVKAVCDFDDVGIVDMVIRMMDQAALLGDLYYAVSPAVICQSPMTFSIFQTSVS